MLALGIDARGGTATRARAVGAGSVVHEGSGGPGNPLMVRGDALREHYEAALAGFPEPDVAVACVAGSGHEESRCRVETLLRTRFPAAAVHVLPDYAAAWAAAPANAAAVVVAGTGSVGLHPARGRDDCPRQRRPRLDDRRPRLRPRGSAARCSTGTRAPTPSRCRRPPSKR